MTASVTILVDGEAVDAPAGVPLGAVLHARRTVFRRSPSGSPRGLWCAMGACLECRVEVGGRTVRACLVPVRVGMVVRTGGEPS
jgi:predicted molibdopterin-dependent oxidoreductase YjgC